MHQSLHNVVERAGLAGAGIDYTHVTNVRNSLQVALDVALLAGAKDGSTDWANVALNSFNANVNSGDASVATPTFVSSATQSSPSITTPP